MDFVLTLTSSAVRPASRPLPHGGVWLARPRSTATSADRALQALEKSASVPMTLGITPVLANQLAHPSFVSDSKRTWSAGSKARPARPRICPRRELTARASRTTGTTLTPLLKLFRSLDGDLIGRAARVRGPRAASIISSPQRTASAVLARDETFACNSPSASPSTRGCSDAAPRGAGFRSVPHAGRGLESPGAGAGGLRQMYRAGIDEHLAAAGYPISSSTRTWSAAARRSDIRKSRSPGVRGAHAVVAYRVASSSAVPRICSRWCATRSVRAGVVARAGISGRRVVSRVPQIRWPDVCGCGCDGSVDLGGKQRYDPSAASNSVRAMPSTLPVSARDRRPGAGAGRGARCTATGRDRAVRRPKLFGHWWFEGVDFLAQLYRTLSGNGVRPVTAGQTCEEQRQGQSHGPAHGRLVGQKRRLLDVLNDQTSWTCSGCGRWSKRTGRSRRKRWPAPKPRAVLAQATRSMLLAQASDWQSSSPPAKRPITPPAVRRALRAGGNLVRALANGKIDERRCSGWKRWAPQTAFPQCPAQCR